MTALQAIVLALLAALGVATVLSYDPRRQVIVNGFFGLALTLLMTVLGAPDVAISAIVVSAIVYPAILLVTINRSGHRKDGGG